MLDCSILLGRNDWAVVWRSFEPGELSDVQKRIIRQREADAQVRPKNDMEKALEQEEKRRKWERMTNKEKAKMIDSIHKETLGK